MLPQPTEEQHKSPAKELIQRQLQKQGKNIKKKLLKKGAKIAAKLIKKAAIQFVALLGKLLAWLVGTIGLPVIGIGILIIVFLVVINLSWSYLFGTGEGLQGKDKELHQYIVQQANSTVNMKSSVERPYRVPEKLIAAVVQLEVFQNKEDAKKVINKMATQLAPVFEYGKYDEWREKQITTCEDGKCIDGPLEHTENKVTKLDHVEYWNGSTTFTYTAHVTAWQSSTKITTKKVKETQQKVTWAPVWIWSDMVNKNDRNYPYYDETSDIYQLLFNMEIRQREGIMPKPDDSVKVFVKKTSTETVEREIEVKTITWTRHQYFTSTQTSFSDYAKLDSILNSYGLGMADKEMLETNYLFSGGTIAYTDWLNGMTGGGGYGYTPYDGTITPGGGVPPQFMPFYLSAEKKYGVHWNVLAAIHFVETSFSTDPHMISSVGAIGPMQFMPATWAGWSYNIGGGLVSSSTDITSLAVIAAGHGYGRDGNGDGKADPWSEADSIHTAAYYLASNNYAKDVRGAIFQYNHAEWYVNKVLENAEKFKNAATYEGGSTVQQVVTVGNRWIGHSTYVFGGGRNQSDISRGIFDCSSFVHWAFNQVGINLGPLGSTSTETLNKIGTRIDFKDARPGDIVFFDTYKKDGHVGIYVGNNKFIGCQTSTGVAIADMNSSYYKKVFSGHVRRIIQ